MQFLDFPAILRQNAGNISKQTPRLQQRVTPTRKAPRYRLQVAHINVGGLSSARLAEIKYWSRMNDIDIVLLTETRWSFESEWDDGEWAHLHSGTSQDRADGMLFLIRRSACPPDRIGFRELMPGRLCHLRIHFQSRALDLVGCYQYVDTRTHTCRKNRENFWDSFDNLLGSLPKRNSFMVCGDLNCSLVADGLHVGHSSFTWQHHKHRGPAHSDMTRLHAILQHHSLVAANTWNETDPPTFVNGMHASRIDHFLMRLTECDVIAKDVKFFQDAGFLPIGGAFHVPMVCSIRRIPYNKSAASSISSCTYNQRLQCRAAWRDQTPKWIDFQTQLQETWHHLSIDHIQQDTVIDDLHNAFRDSFHNHFPRCLRSCSEPDMAQLQAFRSKWWHRRQLTQTRRCQVPDLFKAWYHACRFSNIKRHQQVIARDRKRQQLHDLMQEVANAAACNDSFTIYQAVHRFTPKQAKRKIRLRTEDGNIADSADVLRLTAAHVKEVWDGPSRVFFPCAEPPGVPFTLDELVREFQHIPVVKSVARPYLPGLCWKACAYETACFVFHLLQQWWTQLPFFIPNQWKQAWLTFISKPNKPPDRLSHLRPLALQEPIGKCVLGLLNKKLAIALRPKIAAWPQFAFCAHRSPLDAIKRVANHCREIRQLIGLHRRTVHQRADEIQAHAVCGGLQLYVDVHQAFDRIPRQPLFDFLHSQHIDPALIALLAAWHSDTEYVIWNPPTAHPLPTGRGVRQGCRAAPTLWLSYTLALFHAVAERTSQQWLQDCLTMFADDLHTGEIFRSTDQLRAAIHRIGLVLDAMEEMGLTLALDKTFVLLHICGTNCRTIKKQIIQHDHQGPYLEVPRVGKSPTRLRIRTQAKYLGVTVSYTTIEALTMQTRMKAAQITFQRLKRWLCTSRISLRSRLQMWQSCVFMSLIYGLFAVDLTLPLLQKAQTFIFGMYRKILRRL